MKITNSVLPIPVQPKKQSKSTVRSAELKSIKKTKTPKKKPTIKTNTTEIDENYENPWTFNGEPVYQTTLKGFQAFVYLITNITTGRKYIGKKFVYSLRKAKGATRRSSSISDWQKYYGSNDILKAEVSEQGAANFKREILHLCKTRGEANFREVEEQFLRFVLVSDDYFNDNIHGKWYSVNVKKYPAR